MLIFSIQSGTSMQLKAISRKIVVGGVLLIWTVKFLIRPFLHIPSSLKLLVGIAPNLIGSFLLPFGGCWFFQRIFKLQTQHELAITCYFGLLLVIVNEYLQLIPFFGRKFDYLDILSSVAGVFLGHFVFARMMRNSLERVFE